MGLANAERTLSVLRTLAEFIAQPEYKEVVPVYVPSFLVVFSPSQLILSQTSLSIVNEILFSGIPEATAKSFYLRALDVVREATWVLSSRLIFTTLTDSSPPQRYWRWKWPLDCR